MGVCFSLLSLPLSACDLLHPTDTRKVYGTVVSREDHLVRRDGGAYNCADFTANPEEYTSTFAEKVVCTSLPPSLPPSNLPLASLPLPPDCPLHNLSDQRSVLGPQYSAIDHQGAV